MYSCYNVEIHKYYLLSSVSPAWNRNDYKSKFSILRE